MKTRKAAKKERAAIAAAMWKAILVTQDMVRALEARVAALEDPYAAVRAHEPERGRDADAAPPPQERGCVVTTKRSRRRVVWGVADLRRGARPAGLPSRFWFASPRAMSEWLRRSPDASHYHARIVEVMKGGSRRLPAAIAKMPARKEGA